jgi:mRNA interferase MazF
VTRTVRGIRSEVEVGSGEGLPATSVISCHNLITVSKSVLHDRPVGRLNRSKRAELDRALRYALDIAY